MMAATLPDLAGDAISIAAIDDLRALDQGGAPVIFRELVDLFADSTPRLLSQACGALGNPTQLAIIAHTLKGSCSNFGAHQMEALCVQLEDLGRRQGTAGAREIIEAIEQEFFRVRAALAHYYAAI